MFLRFDSATSCLTLVDSASKSGTRDVAILHNSFTAFLSNFGFYGNSTSFEHVQYIAQLDSNSFEACEYMVIENMCKFLLTNHKIPNEPLSTDLLKFCCRMT